MTGEELDRTMAFLLEQQANFDARMTRFEAIQERDHAALMTLRDVVASSASLSQRLGETQLAMGVSLQEMQRAEARTDERLNALILTVEKLINRNGKPGH